MDLYHNLLGVSSPKVAIDQASQTADPETHRMDTTRKEQRDKEYVGVKTSQTTHKQITRAPTIWFKFCCDIAPLGGALGPGVGVEWTGVPGNGCWEGIIPLPFTPGPMLPLRGPGLGAPPGADIIDDY
ncbi:Mediator complex subunit Med11 [Penicillium robsamsonii]|uniref:Mediator complex subunit Med11 n=1 Tax=Penicillium robsamsonii TaxID=1792511 RepID=UPI0025492DB3|nr:Mediator complex subunit Med11 [Penicillium robsamsonii]KAJ5824673.1 Mediator complex subunit Med11 [Penicillium robsamsonii]